MKKTSFVQSIARSELTPVIFRLYDIALVVKYPGFNFFSNKIVSNKTVFHKFGLLQEDAGG